MTVVPPVPRNGGQILMQQLRIHGARRVFLVPGESYLPCIDALHEHAGAIEPVVPPGKRRRLHGRGLRQAHRRAGHLLRHARSGRHQRQHRRAHGLPGFHAHDPVRGPGRQRLHGARGFPGNRLPPHVRPHGQVGRPDRPLRPHPRVHRPRLRHRHQRPARPVVLALPEDTLWGTATVPDMPRYQRVPNHPGAPDLERLRAALDAARHPFLLLAAAAGPPGRSSASPPSPSPSSCRSARPGGGWNASTSAIPTPPARSAGHDGRAARA